MTLHPTVEFDWVDDRRPVAGLVRVEPIATGPTALLVVVSVVGDEPVVLLDLEMPPPGRTLELRSSGVWVEVVTLERNVSWQVGLEAFALRVDAGEAVTPDTHGDRVPIGLDLGFVASDTSGAVDVEGEVLVGDEAFDLVGRGVRGEDPPPHRGEPVVNGVAVSWPNPRGVLERLLVQRPPAPAWVSGPRQSMSASV